MMRMISVLYLQADDEIEVGTKLIVIDEKDEINNFVFTDCCGGLFMDDDGIEIDVYYTLNRDFLNFEVKLIEPNNLL